MRKHIGWYLKGLPGNVHVKQIVFDTLDPDEVIATLQRYADELDSSHPHA